MHDPDGPDPDDGVAAGADAPVPDVDEADEVAKAEARAAAARARLARLRGEAEARDADDGAAFHDGEQRPAKSARARPRIPRRPGRPRWLRRPRRRTIAAVVGILLASASLAASGYMVWRHRATVHQQQLAAEFTAAARQRVTTLMSIDANHARDDYQRIIDDSTGDFKAQMSAMSALMAKQTEESKVSSKATVEAVAVESMSDNSAVLLVAARSDVINADNSHRPPVVWRISVDLTRDGGQLKMSKVDFLR
ncbi:hypothetical protein A5756_22740 [Mycobacterium sp. 852002-53434_SCH5985345]|uniref:hypothetical protein n=1 Tax=Mycobacterium sp. 852002-53434_SCH5985345 TaxID=1834107 RepID=UPI0007FC3153|nr:hypothetical protein [Mycobacterium sp. 852002-53434_SCH5985345]OBF50098.1 hypothetical protein A5756_22740 [Mycobacterium sp. 852002-53434_SCH5985345]